MRGGEGRRDGLWDVLDSLCTVESSHDVEQQQQQPQEEDVGGRRKEGRTVGCARQPHPSADNDREDGAWHWCDCNSNCPPRN